MQPDIFTAAQNGDPSALMQYMGKSGPTQIPDLRQISGQLSQYQPIGSSSPSSQAKETPKENKGNIFTRMLPTVGGILGGLVSLPLELAPGAGTAANVAGAAGGSALGKVLENKLEGNAGGDNVLASGIEGAAGQAAGGLIGSAAKTGMGVLGRVTGRGSNKLIQGQFAKGTLDADTASALNTMGITNAQHINQVAPIVTGSNGALSNAVRRGLTESQQGVDLSGLSSTARNLVAENQMQLNPGTIPDVSKTVESALLQAASPEDVTQMVARGGKGAKVSVFAPGALQNILPENAFKVTQNFEQLANKAYQGAYDRMGNVNPDQLAKYNVFKGLANHARDVAFGGDMPIPLSDVNKAQIIKELEPLRGINPTTYNHFVDQVTNASNLQDLRPIQAPIVRANQALQSTQNMEDLKGGMSAGDVVKTVAPMAGSVVAGVPGMVTGMGMTALQSNAADRLGAGLLSRLTDVLTNPTMQSIVKQAGPPAAQVVAHAPNYVPGAASQPIGENQMPEQQVTQSQPNPLQEAYQAALLHPYMPGSMDTLREISPALQRLSGAGAALSGAEQAFQAAGGGQGMLGGLLARLGGALTGGPTATYSKQAEQLQKQLEALGIPASYIPQITNTPEAATQGFTTLQNLIGAMGGASPMLASVPAR